MCQRIHRVSPQWINFLLLPTAILLLLSSSVSSFVAKDSLHHYRQSTTERSTTAPSLTFMSSPTSRNLYNTYHHRHYSQMQMSGVNHNDYDSLSSSSSSSSSSFMSKLLSRFQGDFDNYHQVYTDRKNGLLPKEGGGHEHFHVTLIPLDEVNDILLSNENYENENDGTDAASVEGAVLAAYYFDGMPNRIFRLRLYTFERVQSSSNHEKEGVDDDGDEEEEEEEQVIMKLYTLNPSLEGILRQTSGQEALETWISTIKKYSSGINGRGDGNGSKDRNNSNGNEDSNSGTVKSEPLLIELKRCDILWSTKPDPVRHSYFAGKGDINVDVIGSTISREPSDAFHAIMINDHDIGGVKLESQMAPGLYIRIQDELSLWEDELWVNDRGHNAETGAMVYGNYAGTPYKMNRVSSMVSVGEGKFERTIIDASLSWTLGDEYRTAEEYDSKMKDVGGTTTSYRPKKT